jgi:hypothetical protein
LLPSCSLRIDSTLGFGTFTHSSILPVTQIDLIQSASVTRVSLEDNLKLLKLAQPYTRKQPGAIPGVPLTTYVTGDVEGRVPNLYVDSSHDDSTCFPNFNIIYIIKERDVDGKRRQ